MTWAGGPPQGIPQGAPSPGAMIPRPPGSIARMNLSARQEYDQYIQNKLRMMHQPRPIVVQQVEYSRVRTQS